MNDNNLTKDRNYSNSDNHDDWDNADNDWQNNKLIKKCFIIYNGRNSIFYGRKSKKSYKVGDAIEVKIIKVDILKYQIDLELT